MIFKAEIVYLGRVVSEDKDKVDNGKTFLTYFLTLYSMTFCCWSKILWHSYEMHFCVTSVQHFEYSIQFASSVLNHLIFHYYSLSICLRNMICKVQHVYPSSCRYLYLNLYAEIWCCRQTKGSKTIKHCVKDANGMLWSVSLVTETFIPIHK